MMLLEESNITGVIYGLLHHLGADASTTGFFHTACAARLAAEDPERLILVTKWLYPEVAQHYHCSWQAVEHNIRRLVEKVWREHPERLEILADRKLQEKPSPAQFLAILSNFLRQGRAA